MARALANPAYFAEIYFRPYDPNWSEVIPRFGVDMLGYMATTQRGVVMLPPEFMKTTLGSQVYALWRTVRATVFGEMFRGMLASEEEGMARANLSVLRWHVENNERLHSDFVANDGKPLLRPDPTTKVWRDDAMIVARVGTSRDPTWQAKGLDSKGVQGRRLDCLIADDLITPRNAESPALRKRALDMWDLAFETRLVGSDGARVAPRGQALALGNFNDSRDLLSILSRRPGWRLFKRPSIHKPGNPEEPPSNAEWEEAVETWPQVWPKERLLAERTAKPQRFRRIHLLDPRAEGGEALKVSWVQVIQPPQVPLRYGKFYMGLDGAPGGDGEDLDFFNVTVGCLYQDHLDICDSFDRRGTVDTQVDLLWQVYQRYDRVGNGVQAIGLPKVAMDRYLGGAIAIKYPELEHKLVPISTPGSKDDRIVGLGPYASSGWLRVVEGAWLGLTSDHVDQWQEQSLYEQWKEFPFGKHDDKLDGLDVCIRTTREYGGVDAQDREVELTAVAAYDPWG